jgi:alpha-tubulin suppressor-like RCC1 family protein
VLTNAQLSDSGSKFSCLVTNAYGTALSSNAVLKVIETVSNDLCSAAVLIPAAPYTVVYATTQSTAKATSIGDPVPDCIPDFGNGVWYQFTPPNSGLLTVDTFDSDFDTGLAVYTGACDSMTEVACNDDTDGITSQVILPVTGGTTYSILAGGYSAYVGNLALHLTYATPPAVLVQPVSQEVVVSNNATLTVVAGGTEPLNYQWYLNGVALTDNARLSGSATSTLSISNVLTSDGGTYTVVVSNLLGTATSAGAVLSVVVPPRITVPPAGRAAVLGQPVSFSVTASGTPLYYQWQLNSADIPGATNSTYAIGAVGTNDLGIYHLVVSNLGGVAVSADAQLTRGQIAVWGRNDYGQTVVPPELTNVVMVAGGGAGSAAGHSLALKADGTVVAWGWNVNGQTNVPASATNVVAVAAGGMHSLALRADGRVIAWGSNSSGQTNVPTTLSNVVAVAAGYYHSLVLRADGKVVAWGDNAYGQTSVPTNLIGVVAIGSGVLHSLAVCADGTVVAWGNYGSYGQTNVPPNATNVVAAVGGLQNSLALRANGTVVSWGTNTVVTSLTNIIAGLTNATGIGAGESYYVALRADGTVLAWGSNAYGQTNTPAYVNNAVAVAGGGSHVLALIGEGRPILTRQPVGGSSWVGRNFTLTAAAAGTVPLYYQWQFNGADIPGATNLTLALSSLALTNAGNYQLVVSNALGTAASIPAPLTVLSNNMLTFWSLPAGQTNYQSTRIQAQASVTGNGPLTWQWFFSTTNKNFIALPGATNDTLTLDPALAVQSGYYYLAVSNQIAGKTGGITSAPVSVKVQFARAWGYNAVSNPPVNVTNAIAVATGGGSYSYGTPSYSHYFALGADGKLASWANYYPSYGETNISALTNAFVTAIAANYQHSLALRSDGTVHAWGNGPTNPPSGLSGVIGIACGYQHDLALKSDGTVVAWGNNTYGQSTNYAAATNAVAIAAGNYFNLVLRADGTVVGWGDYKYGQTTIPASATNVIAIAAGLYHSLALRANGTVIGWGDNSYGVIAIPAGQSNFVAIAASGYHSTLLRNDGTVLSLGYGYGGFLSNTVPADLANVIAVSSGGDRDFALLGTRAPAFTIQPVSRTVSEGTTNVLLAAKVSGVQPVTCQWRFNGANIAGATNDTLFQTNIQFTHAGTYQLVASNAYGVVASKPAKLAVTIPLGEALDTTNRTWTTSGNSLWYGQTNVTHDGADAARSGEVGASQETILQTTVITNRVGRCVFWWKVSSEEYFDVLEFRVNGVTQASISGEVDWQQCAIQLSPGTNILQWRYSKDASYSSGLDAAWVDQFSFLPGPVITTQPFNQTGYAGTTAYFSVYANGTPPLGYQWQKNGVNLANGGNVSGANSYSLGLSNIQDADAAWYTVVVTNMGGCVTSTPALLTVLISPPIINSQPVSLTNYAGTTATFLVSAGGPIPMSYQWQKNGTNLTNGGNVSGATTSTLTLTNVQDADAAIYTATITNAFGSVTSTPASLTVLDSPPVITSQPASCNIFVGTAANFAVAAIGANPFSYQWQFNGTNLDGATNSSLILNNVRPVNTGPYQVVVTNAFGSATSSVAILTVTRSRVVAWGNNYYGQTNVPANLLDVMAIDGGNGHSLALQANGTVAAWGFNSYGQTDVPPGLTSVTAIAGGDRFSMALRANGTMAAWGENTYGMTNVPASLTNVARIAAGCYHSLALRTDGRVVAWGGNSYGETNVPADLTNGMAVAAGEMFSLALQTDGAVVAWGYNYNGQTSVPAGLGNVVAISTRMAHALALKANGTVVAWGYNYYGQTNVPAGLTNVVAIAAGNDHSLALQTDGRVVAWGIETNVSADLTNVVAIAAGNGYSLVIQNDGSPIIIRHTGNQTVLTNTTVIFQVTALGQSSLSYQWQKNGINLTDGDNVSGSTTATLTLNNVQAVDIAAYTVVITNDIDRVTSSPALLTVIGPPMITLQPLDLTVNLGTNVQFNVAACGCPAPAYQWWQNGTNPIGFNSPNLTLSNASRAQNGVYCVQVTNAWGSVLSSNATLTVLVPQILGVPVLLPDGTLQLISGDADGGLLSASDLPNFEAWASTNLIDWETLPGALSLTNGLLLLQEDGMTNWPQRYYRITENPIPSLLFQPEHAPGGANSTSP